MQNLCEKFQTNHKNKLFKGIPSYFFLFLKMIVHEPMKNKLYYLIV